MAPGSENRAQDREQAAPSWPPTGGPLPPFGAQLRALPQRNPINPQEGYR